MTKACVIFGGTFDPVHNGHVQTARDLAQQLGFEKITLMPCGDAYHKASEQASAADRYAMLEKVAADEPALAVDSRELNREGATYTVDTLRELRQELGADAHISWVMGQDAANGLPQWKDWQSLFELANVIVVARPNETWPDMRRWPAEYITVPNDFKLRSHGAVFCITLTQLAISSSLVRQKVKDQQSIDDLVPKPVVNWIQANGLYS